MLWLFIFYPPLTLTSTYVDSRTNRPTQIIFPAPFHWKQNKSRPYSIIINEKNWSKYHEVSLNVANLMCHQYYCKIKIWDPTGVVDWTVITLLPLFKLSRRPNLIRFSRWLSTYTSDSSPPISHKIWIDSPLLTLLLAVSLARMMSCKKAAWSKVGNTRILSQNVFS